MRRIFSNYAYSDEPRAGCWWDETITRPTFDPMDADIHTDVAIIGGGFTGLNAALRLSEAGVGVTVLEARHIGWGASGRNGGFCCLGGGKASDGFLDKRYGKADRLAYRATEKAAVEHVSGLIEKLGLNVDRHSNGETELAHRPRDLDVMKQSVERTFENYGVTPEIIAQNDLSARGMVGPFHGAMTVPIGFALNPAKYVAGLAHAAHGAGVQIFENCDVTQMQRGGSKWVLGTGTHRIFADQIVIATNGYSSETVPDWLSGRYMPVQSNVIVTRPLTDVELAKQGWTTDQMAYDSRNLLHYFRLMPDGRMLFGLRGGLFSSPSAQKRAKSAAMRDFRTMFPAWTDVDVTHSWSGMVSVARNQTPFVGEIPRLPGVWAGLCYHGNGVAMGSYAGKMLADLITDSPEHDAIPNAITSPLVPFPFGAARRVVMPAIYAGLMLGDI